MTATSASEFAATRSMAVSIPLTFFVAIAVFASLTVLSIVVLDYPATTFRSPDEYASYTFTEAFAQTGKPYYTADYLQNDAENLLHPRGALTFEGRAVPFNDLGLQVLYGPVFRAFGKNLRYIAIPLSLITATALARAGGIFLGKRKEWLAWIGVLGLVPLVYYLNRPLTNVAPAITFLTVGLYFLISYFRQEQASSIEILPAGLSFGLAGLMRYEWAIFLSLLVLLVLFHKHETNWRRLAPALVAFALAITVSFVLPVLVLNKITYGSPSTFGYSLFHQAYFPERAPATAGLPWSALNFARYVLWPSGSWDLGLAARSFVFQVLGVAPVLALTAGFGATTLVRRHGSASWPMVAYGLLGVYFYLYYAASESWLAGASTPNLEASIVRYSLPLYVAFFLLACQGLATLNRNDVALVLAAVLVVVGMQSVIRDGDGNLLYVRNQLRIGDQQTRTSVLPHVESNAFIYTDIFDKTVGPYRKVATWLGGETAVEDGYFKPDEVATSISRLYPTRPVYLYAAYDETVVPVLEPALTDRGLKLVGTQVRRLYRVQPLATAGR